MTDEMDASLLAAAREALDQFPIHAESLELFAVSENITLRVRDPQGQIYALRLHRPGYNSLAELQAERRWTTALARAGIEVQAGVKSRAGVDFVPVTISALGEERYVGLTTWLPGVPLSEVLDVADDPEAGPRAFRDIGRLMARMHHQSMDWEPPPGFTRPRLDGAGLLGETPRWGRFWEHPDLSADGRELLEAARTILIHRLEEYGENLPNFGLIHADLHPENLVLHEQTLSVIDFDDAAYGWFVYDLATALVEFWGTEDATALRAALLEGYREYRELPDRDEQMLDTFILLRGMAIIGWFAQRPEHGDSDYFPVIRDCVLGACRALINPPSPTTRS